MSEFTEMLDALRREADAKQLHSEVEEVHGRIDKLIDCSMHLIDVLEAGSTATNQRSGQLEKKVDRAHERIDKLIDKMTATRNASFERVRELERQYHLSKQQPAHTPCPCKAGDGTISAFMGLCEENARLGDELEKALKINAAQARQSTISQKDQIALQSEIDRLRWENAKLVSGRTDWQSDAEAMRRSIKWFGVEVNNQQDKINALTKQVSELQEDAKLRGTSFGDEERRLLADARLGAMVRNMGTATTLDKDSEGIYRYTQNASGKTHSSLLPEYAFRDAGVNDKETA